MPASPTVRVNDKDFTQFHYSKKLYKPFLWPVNGPEVNGHPVKMTRAYPMADPDLSEDHPHHVSVWVAHGEVRVGKDETLYNTWHAVEGKTAWERVRNITVANGTSYGYITADIDWLSPGEKVKILSEHREYRFYNTPEDARIMDLYLTITASVDDTYFDDTKEGGLFSIRVNDRITVENGGQMTNSEGVKGKDCWGLQANWVDYSGELEGIPCGVTIFDHPSSFRHVPYWHAREYGLLTANVFGLSHFNKGKDNLPQSGDYELKKGQSIKCLFRLPRSQAAIAMPRAWLTATTTSPIRQL